MIYHRNDGSCSPSEELSSTTREHTWTKKSKNKSSIDRQAVLADDVSPKRLHC